MTSNCTHHVVAADAHRVPRPFRTFAVRSEQARHAFVARAPYDRVHLVRTNFLDVRSLAALAADGYARTNVQAFGDIEHAQPTPDELSRLLPAGVDWLGAVAAALEMTRVLGTDALAYRRSVATRVDYLACCGAGFHNDVARHWSGCLFWLLTLDADDVEFVMPHAGVRLALSPGDLVVFDQTMAHGLCRPSDQGRAVASSFDAVRRQRQLFLTGELSLGDAQWAALGAPWLPVQEHERRGALDLMVADFDECSGTVQRVSALQDCMKRSTCHVDDVGD